MKKNTSVPRTAQESIPITTFFTNGIIETKRGHFTKSYELEDINFSIASEDEQKEIFLEFEKLLNYFPTDSRFQLLIHNHKEDKRETLKHVYFKPKQDGFNKTRSIVNEVIMSKLSSGTCYLKQDKYLTVSIKDSDAGHAIQRFRTIDVDVNRCISQMSKDVKTEPMSLEDRIHVLERIYNGNTSSYYNAKKPDGTGYLDIKTLVKQGLKIKDVIAPDGMRFEDNFFMLGEQYCRSLFLAKIPSGLSTDFITDLSNINCEHIISVYLEPLDTKDVLKDLRNHLTNINGEIGEAQKHAYENNYSLDVLPAELESFKDSTKDTLNDILKRDQKMFAVTFCVTVFSDTKNGLNNACEQIVSVANKYVCQFRTLLAQQEDGFNQCLPLALNTLSENIRRYLTTESASIFIPYTSQELFHKHGNFYGTNQVTGNIIMYNRKAGRNYNGLFFGDPGSGKSADAKFEIISSILRDETDAVYIIDPQDEYRDIAEAYNGEVIDLAPGSKTFLNPFDMDIMLGENDEPLSMKADYIIGMIEMMLSGGNEHRTLDPKAKSIVVRCVQNIYRGYIQHIDTMNKSHGVHITIDKNAVPTMQKLYYEFLRQPEPEARSLATIIEIYIQDSYSVFSHHSNTDTNKRIIVYNIKNLGTGMKALGLYICINDILNKMMENYKKGLWTRMYIDEFPLVLQSEGAAKYMMQIWKTVRKWNGIPTGILQGTEDLLVSKTTRDIVNTTPFVMLHALQQSDRENIMELLQIPSSQLRFITNCQSGTGLIYTGNTVIPFDNRVPKNNPLYNLISTSKAQDAQDFAG